MDVPDHVAIGGWSTTYARVLADVVVEPLAAALVDTNGDGRHVDFQIAERCNDGKWSDWLYDADVGDADCVTESAGLVYGWGRGQPGSDHVVTLHGESFTVSATRSGWWVLLVIR